MKNAKKLLSILLALVMLVLCGLPALAEEPLHYTVIGDSIGYGSGIINSREACYGKIVADTNGYVYANHSVPGHTTGDLLTVLEDEAVRENLRSTDIVSLTIGGNNFLRGNIMKMFFKWITGDVSFMEEIADGAYADLQSIVSILRELNPDAKVLLQNLYNPQVGVIKEFYDVGLVALNAVFAAVAAENEGFVYLIDVQSAFGSDANPYIAADRIHPNALGNEAIARAVLEKLFDLGLGENTEPVINTPGKDFVPAFSLESFFEAIRNFFLTIWYKISGIMPY